MSSDPEPPMVSEDEEFRDERAAEVDELGPAKTPSNWQRWAAVGVLVVVGVATFMLAWILSAGIPADGDARTEAQVTALVSAGATSVAAAVAIAAVVLTLGLQREQEQQKRWADFQLTVLREAYEWIERVYGHFGSVISAMEEWANAVEADRMEKFNRATQIAQDFYDQGQRLSEVERLELLIADRDVRAALRHADGALRVWNETVAGDHTTREVRLTDTEGSAWDSFSALADAREVIRQRYSRAVWTVLLGE